MTMDRRTLIRAGVAALTTGGSFMSGALNRAFAQDFMTGAPGELEPGRAFTELAVNVFSAATRAQVAAICETIIPATDTPGAMDAGVPKFIELLYAYWMTDEERAVFVKGLDDLDVRLHMGAFKTASDARFVSLTPAQRQTLLETVEEETDHPWFELGGVSFLQSSQDVPPFIVMIKEFTVTGYFMSELGASEVLELSPMGEFDGDIKLKRGASSWAAKPLM